MILLFAAERSGGDPAQVYRERDHWPCWNISFSLAYSVNVQCRGLPPHFLLAANEILITAKVAGVRETA
jgi:hypothetical protein